MFWVLDDDRVEVINAGFTKQINIIIFCALAVALILAKNNDA